MNYNEWKVSLPADKYRKYRDAFMSQKRHATTRQDRNGAPIEFRLSWDEWLTIWYESGQLDSRGRGRGLYVMSRRNDLGHYELGNVVVKLSSENTKEAHLGRRVSDEHKRILSKTHKGVAKPRFKCGCCGGFFPRQVLNKYHEDNCRRRF